MRTIKAFSFLGLMAASACAEDLDYTPLQFVVSDAQVIVTGEIDGDALDTFEDMLQDHPDVRTLVLRYVPGSVDDEANVELSRLVRELGFTTVVPAGGLVASGGTDLFLAGKKRVIEAGACVGVHSWAADDFTATDIPIDATDHDRYLDYYRDISIDPAFYWFTIQAAPADGMHWMTAQEIKQFDAVTSAIAPLSAAAVCDIR